MSTLENPRLRTAMAEHGALESPPCPTASPDHVRSACFAARLCRSPSPLDAADRHRLLHFARKLEVPRRVYARYRLDGFTPDTGAGIAPLAAVNGMLTACLRAHAEDADLRYLNTVFKVMLVGLLEPDGVLDERLLELAEELLSNGAHDARD